MTRRKLIKAMAGLPFVGMAIKAAALKPDALVVETKPMPAFGYPCACDNGWILLSDTEAYSSYSVHIRPHKESFLGGLKKGGSRAA